MKMDWLAVAAIVAVAALLVTMLLASFSAIYRLGGQAMKLENHERQITSNEMTVNKIFVELKTISDRLHELPCPARDERYKALEARLLKAENEITMLRERTHDLSQGAQASVLREVGHG